MSTSDFRDLEVWKKARTLAIAVYGVTRDGRLAKDFGLRDQMRRAAVSICSNIAEGNEMKGIRIATQSDSCTLQKVRRLNCLRKSTLHSLSVSWMPTTQGN